MSQFVFSGVAAYGDPQPLATLSASFVEYLKWGLLEIGAFERPAVSQESPFGEKFATLALASDPNYAAGRVWEGRRTDWVWETTTTYATHPIPVTTVVVDGDETELPFVVDYPNGRVIFDDPLDTTSVVAAAHTFRSVQVRRVDEPWWSAPDSLSMRPDDTRFSAAPGARGELDISPRNRRQMPAWEIQSLVGGGVQVPYEVGSTRSFWRVPFIVHCLAETAHERDWLLDVLRKQEGRALPTYDLATAPYPLDSQGTPYEDALTYPELCSAYPWKTAHFDRVTVDSGGREGGLYYGQAQVVIRTMP